ncbi:MAG: glycoside hydrolase family 9 protein [Lentisphaerae bacterium]|nr:glycoside hydrolase family 9 protein [Lentisphaerota bacterium]
MENAFRLNHVGFRPDAAKKFVLAKPGPSRFQVLRLDSCRFSPVFEGQVVKTNNELGNEEWLGDFSAVREDGIYRLQCGEEASRCFTVYRNVYDVPARVLLIYFNWQRCGETAMGWHGPCHLDDGLIAETGQHRDFSGGFHQSSDLRKWAHGVPLGLVGLCNYAKVLSPHWDTNSIASELMWGSDYYHKVIADNGMLYDSVYLPVGWDAREYYLSANNPLAHWNTLRFLAEASSYFRGKDRYYHERCAADARRIWNYMVSPERSYSNYTAPKLPPIGHNCLNSMFSCFYEDSALEIAYKLAAAAALFRATGEQSFLDTAAISATALAELQLKNGTIPENPASACFRESSDNAVLANSHNGYLWAPAGPLSLCDALQIAPDHPNASIWKDCIARIAEQYEFLARRNIWDLIPTIWQVNDSASADGYKGGYIGMPGTGESKLCSYKYYHVLNNMDIIANAVFMKKAARILSRVSYAEIAQRQLDWILGANPFDASSVEGVGYNQPNHFFSGEFFPPTPQIPGGVCVGITETSMNPSNPINNLGHEYDMPIVGFLIWLLAEISDFNG